MELTPDAQAGTNSARLPWDGNGGRKPEVWEDSPAPPTLGRPQPRRRPRGSPLEDPSLPTRAAQQLLQPVERGAAVGPVPARGRLHGGRGARLVPGADPQLPVLRHRPASAGKPPRTVGSRADLDNDRGAAGL